MRTEPHRDAGVNPIIGTVIQIAGKVVFRAETSQPLLPSSTASRLDAARELLERKRFDGATVRVPNKTGKRVARGQKFAARPAASKAKMEDGKTGGVKGMIGRGIICTLFFPFLTNIPLTSIFSKADLRWDSPSRQSLWCSAWRLSRRFEAQSRRSGRQSVQVCLCRDGAHRQPTRPLWHNRPVRGKGRQASNAF